MIARLLIAALIAIATLAPAGAADLVIGLGADVTSIDPHNNNAAPNNSIAEQIFNKLIENDARQNPKPGLAESWRTVDDLTWEFKLRRGVKFHDGSDFTAADVAFSIERPSVINTPGGFTIFTRSITEKIIVDPYTIRLKTAAPYPNLPIDMSGLIIVSSVAAKGALAADFDSGKATIGTGPWKFVRYIKGDRIELARNDNYWGPKPPWDKVTFRLITSDPSRVAALLAGDVQMIEAIPPADYAKLKTNKDIAIFTTISNRMIHLHLDSNRDKSPFITDKAGKPLEKNPFKDARVRKAVSKAINRNAMVERVMDGLAIPAGQLMPEGFFGVSPNLKPEPFDPDGAKKLLAEAGYPDGFGITLHGPNNRYVNDDQIVQAVAQMLTRVGIATKVETLPFSVYVSRANKVEFSAALLGWGVSTGEATYPLRSLIATYNPAKGLGTWNWGRYTNPAMDALLEQGLATVDNAKRDKLLQQATELVINDTGLIPLHFQVNTWAARRGIVYTPRTDERTYAHDVRAAP
ncbi:MAG: ABC transporter substrate-binding protein [Betaproteobacteria bacterium]|nr:ABC transporter substrate-binding protein [Betaproteobacteria bacterium]